MAGLHSHNQDDHQRPSSGVHQSPFSSSFFAPAKLFKSQPRKNDSEESLKQARQIHVGPVPKLVTKQSSELLGTDTIRRKTIPHPLYHGPHRTQSATSPTATLASGPRDSLFATSSTSATKHQGLTDVGAQVMNVAPQSTVRGSSVSQSVVRASRASAGSVSSPAGARLRASNVSQSSASGLVSANNFSERRGSQGTSLDPPSTDAFSAISNSALSNGAKLDVDSHAVARAVAVTRSLPRELFDCVRHLSAFSYDCLLPAQVLAKVWKVDLAHACKLISLLGDTGIVRHATLESGATWCVPTRTFATALHHVFREDIPLMHAAVLAVYEDQPNFTSWVSVKDDGFINLQMIRHLGATRRIDEIRELLLDAAWLENKTHCHGPAAVAKDFQMAFASDQSLVSLCNILVQAYSISIPSVFTMPHSGTLLTQMLLRTAAICQLVPDLEPTFYKWWHSKVLNLPLTTTIQCMPSPANA